MRPPWIFVQELLYLWTLLNSVAAVIIERNMKIGTPLSVQRMGWAIPLQNGSSAVHVLNEILWPFMNLVVKNWYITWVFCASTCNALGTASTSSSWRVGRTVLVTLHLLWVIVITALGWNAMPMSVVTAVTPNTAIVSATYVPHPRRRNRERCWTAAI